MSLQKQIWLTQIQENFYPDTSFLSKAVNLDGYVENDQIHMAEAGIDPAVRVNENTYPIKAVERPDGDCVFILDKFETENTLIRRPDAIELSYNKLESVIGQHRKTLQTAVAKKALHAYAPQQNTENTPVIATTGEAVEGRKRLRFADILKLKEKFDKALVPLENRYLVLDPAHVTDLLLEDMQLFKNLTQIKDGEPEKFAGFGIFSFPYTPKYLGMEKQNYNEQTSINFASVAFQADEVMRADGEIYMYSRIDDPEERATLVGFDKRFIALPIRNKGIGAIVSANA